MSARTILRAFQRVLSKVDDDNDLRIMAIGIEVDGGPIEPRVGVSIEGVDSMVTTPAGARLIADQLAVPMGIAAGLGDLVQALRTAADVCDAQIAALRGEMN